MSIPFNYALAKQPLNWLTVGAIFGVTLLLSHVVMTHWMAASDDN
jgi:hypothetical protein